MRKISVIFSILLTVFCGCQKEEERIVPDGRRFENVLIYYGCGQNNLDDNMKKNIADMTGDGCYIPTLDDGNALVTCLHETKDGHYRESGPTNITWIYRNGSEVVRDRIATLSYTTISDEETMRTILSEIARRFESERYGLVFSSHGTGWMPQGSYKETGWDFKAEEPHRLTSYGQEVVGDTDYFIDIPEMTAAIPFHTDYIIFDACLMGGIEVAYEMRNVTDVIGFSQCEVLNDGFYYPNMTRRLLLERNPVGVIEDTYNYYKEKKSGYNSSCAVSCIRCANLSDIAAVCRELFESYRQQIAAVKPGNVQRFYTDNHHWFYDLQDLLVKSGMSVTDGLRLQTALDGCVLYCAHTDRIFSQVDIDTDCGFSTIIPNNCSQKLLDYYKTLEWNKATSFVK